MYSKIVNPKTGRMVSVNGKLGKEILRNYLNVLEGGAASTPTVAPNTPVRCIPCRGSGSVAGQVTCPTCSGNGYLTNEIFPDYKHPCWTCNGTTQVAGTVRCAPCNGSGWKEN